MRKSYHIESFILIFINVAFAIMVSQHDWAAHTLVEWGAMSNGIEPTVQTLHDFPPFNLLSESGILTHEISGYPLLILRSIYASFLQFSWIHLFNNVLVLGVIGKLFEDTNYPGLLTFVYLLTGSVSMISAYYLNPDAITAGASGAIFGILGVCLILGYKAKWLYRHDKMDISISNAYARVGDYVYGLLVYNIVITFMMPNVSIVGHIAGLLCGMIVGLLLPTRKY